MADLKSLIKHRKHLVEEKQRFLSQLYREVEKLERQKEIIEEQMETEITLAREMGTPEASAFLGKYLEGARHKIKVLAVSVSKMNARISAAQEDMRAAFAEMKKVEITQERREERESAEIKKKEDMLLDEIAIEGFRRREEAE